MYLAFVAEVKGTICLNVVISHPDKQKHSDLLLKVKLIILYYSGVSMVKIGAKGNSYFSILLFGFYVK